MSRQLVNMFCCHFCEKIIKVLGCRISNQFYHKVQWRIQGKQTLRDVQTNFSQKMHENEETLGGDVHPLLPQIRQCQTAVIILHKISELMSFTSLANIAKYVRPVHQ